VLLLLLAHPRSVPSLLLGVCAGLLLCPALIGLSHGFIEFGAVGVVFVLAHLLSTGKVSQISSAAHSYPSRICS